MSVNKNIPVTPIPIKTTLNFCNRDKYVKFLRKAMIPNTIPKPMIYRKNTKITEKKFSSFKIRYEKAEKKYLPKQNSNKLLVTFCGFQLFSEKTFLFPLLI